MIRAIPTMLRIGFAESVAYRAELVVWMLSYTMPLVMLALWTAVAADGPVNGYGQADFAAYFVAALVVRMMVAAWVVWELNYEIKQGRLAARLLRPIHPLMHFAAMNLSALPMRIAFAIPMVGIGFALGGWDMVSHDPRQWLLVAVLLFLAWLMTFLVQAIVGTLAFFWESSLALFDLYMTAYIVCSGYVMPLDLVPEPFKSVIDVLPFKYQLSVPIEAILGRITVAETLHAVGMQLVWCAGLLVVVTFVWRAGVRRFAAFGG